MQAEASLVDRYCEARSIPRDRCRESAHRILSASTTLVSESGRLSELRAQFPISKPLSPAARVLRDELIALHIRRLLAAIQEEEGTFPALQLNDARRTTSPGTPAPELHELA